MKKCIKCGILKDYKFFWRDTSKKDNYRSNCKQCYPRVHKKFPLRLKNKRNVVLKVTEQEYNEKSLLQGHCCAVCKSNKPLVADHCHDTVQLRALLCGNCNTALGLMKENTESIKALVTYSQYCNELKNV